MFEKLKALILPTAAAHKNTETRQNPAVPQAPSEAEARLTAICDEVIQSGVYLGARIKLTTLSTWNELQSAPEDLQMDVAIYALSRSGLMQRRAAEDNGLFREEIRRTVSIQLLRRKLPFRAKHVIDASNIASCEPYPEHSFPMMSVITMVERYCARSAPEPDVRRAIEAVLKKVNFLQRKHGWSEGRNKFVTRLEAALYPEEADHTSALPKGRWGQEVETWMAGLPSKERDAWSALLIHAAAAGAKSKPSKKWLADAKPLLSVVKKNLVLLQLKEWLEDLKPDPQLFDDSLDVLKGMIWSAVHLDHDQSAFAIGRFAEVCFTKVPGMGPRSQKLGNACLLTLASQAPSGGAVAELVRLKRKIKYSSVRELIEMRLLEAADASGFSLDDLEQQALPDFGLGIDGRVTTQIGDATAILELDDDGASLSWLGRDAKPRKSVPASVKRDHADMLKELKRKAKDISTAAAGQIAYLETAYLEDRSWPGEVWIQRFLNHTVRKTLAERLIWQIELDEGGIAVILIDGTLFSLNHDEVALAETSRVRLWHPLMSDPGSVLGWRAQIEAMGITQPFKQAHREVYALTDAERATEAYSNRFAAHILRQHQFRALCHARGWKYDLQGTWDSWNIPTRVLERIDLVAKFHVEAIVNDDMSEAYTPLYLSSDQVRFNRLDGTRMDLVDIAPMIFSEVMRDVDLFVAVTSVANDPNWTDGGPDGRFGEYWQEHAFGDLGQSATTRRDVLKSIVPKLAIADRLSITDKFLNVRGQRQSYKIHLGSGNIMIMPSNRYLCIVRGDPKTGSKQVKLPFAGDTMLSTILSKAFMLAEDDKIKDATILSQL